YGNSWTIQDLQSRFDYLFNSKNQALYPPILEPHVIDGFGRPMSVGGLKIVPFEQDHGTCKTVGYRIGDFGYSTDMLNLDRAAIDALKGVRTWIVDAAGYKQTDNKVHAGLETIFALNKEIGAGQVYLTSLTLQMDYQTLSRELPAGYKPAHDGLK